MPVAFKPIEEEQPVAKVRFTPMGGEARRVRFREIGVSEAAPAATVAPVEMANPALGEFMAQPEAGVSEESPLTASVPQEVAQETIQPRLPNEAEQAREQAGTEKPLAIGEAQATVPRFGKEGTIARGASEVIGGLAEWALNKPEEAVATLTPLAPAIAMRYTPEVAAQFVRDVTAGAQGDRQALGRAGTMVALVGVPAAAKRGMEAWRLGGEARGVASGEVPTPDEAARAGMRPEGVAREEQSFTVPVQPETVLPAASETFKAITGEPATEAGAKPGGETAATTTEGVSDAISQQSTAALHGDVLRGGQGGAQAGAVPEDVGEPAKGLRQNEGEGVAGAQGEEVAPASDLTAAKAAAESEVPLEAATGGTGAAGGVEPAASAPAVGEGPVPQVVGIKNAAVDMQRRDRGLPPLMEPLRKSDAALWDAAMARVEADPALPDRLVRELTERPRPMTDEEAIIVEHRLVSLTNDLDNARWEGMKAADAGDAARAKEMEARAGELSDALTVVEQAVGRQQVEGGPGAGTLMGRAFRARQQMIRENFSPAGLERMKREANGFARLNDAQAAEVRRTAEQFKVANDALQARLKEQTETLAKVEAERDLARLKAEEAKAQAKLSGRVRIVVAKVGEALDARAEAARGRLRGKLLSLSPEDLKDIAEIAASNLFHMGEDLARWSAKMVEEIGEQVRPHLADLWQKAHAILEEGARGMAGAGGARKEKVARTRDAAAALEAIKKRLRGRITDYEARIARGDFSMVKKVPPPEDAETTHLRFELEKVKKRWYEGLIEDKMRKRNAVQKAIGGVQETVNAIRAIRTSVDLSAVLRQGKFIVVSHPLRAASSIAPMLKAFASEEAAFKVSENIANRATYPLMRSSKLYLAEHGVHLSQMEEMYMSRLAGKIPVVGPLVKASERAYTTFLNKLRADSFDAMAANLARDGKLDANQAKVVANFINVATGRGTLPIADQAAVGLNTFFFAPRFVASRFQMLLGQPLYYGIASGKVPIKATMAARKLVAREYGHIIAGQTVVYGLGLAAAQYLFGEDINKIISWDPRSSDFAKFKFGNTRVDPMAGLGQVTVFLSKEISGQQKELRTGKVLPIRGKVPYGKPTAWDVGTKFMRTKLAPVPGMVVDVFQGKNVVGEPVTATSLLKNSLVPMSVADVIETAQQQGVPATTALALLVILGESVQNFDATKKAASSDRR